MINVKTLDELQTIFNPEENEYAIVEEENGVYQYVNNEWNPVKVSGDGLKMTLADLNQSIMASLPPLDERALAKGKKKIVKFINNFYDKYYAFISFEHHYITLFHAKDDTSIAEMANEIFDVIQNVGEVKDISNNGHGAIEVWITDGDRTNCFLLFPYTHGVVEI